MDPSGFQPSLIDSPGPAGIWQNPHPPSHHQAGRFPLMPPRDLHFPYDVLSIIDPLNIFIRPQHMRQFRPSLPPPSSPEYRIYDLNKRLSMRTEVNKEISILKFR